MRRPASAITDRIAGGWVVEREIIGAATYWNAWREDARGFTIPGTVGRNLGSRRKALEFIAAQA